MADRYGVMQLLAGGAPACPFDRAPIPRRPLDAFQPNFKVMEIVRTARADVDDNASTTAFRLQPDDLTIDLNARLGSGGFAVVYRGAAPHALCCGQLIHIPGWPIKRNGVLECLASKKNALLLHSRPSCCFVRPGLALAMGFQSQASPGSEVLRNLRLQQRA
jgi:hypothetical protein